MLIQGSLKQVGYDCGPVDGIIGSKTIQAIKAFQRDNDLVIDGVAGVGTLSALISKLATLSASVSTPSKSTRALTQSEIKAVQARLNDLGYDYGEVDGIIGPRTIKAIKAFQDDHDLVVDGIVGPKTLEALGWIDRTLPSDS